ncbi:hypothetical protein ABKN59_002868 [Abortiporus biennis]
MLFSNLLFVSISCIGAVFASVQDFSLEGCVGQEILVTEALLVGERVINMTVPACPSFVPKPYPVHPSESIIARRSNYLAKRQLDTRSTDATKASPSECVNSGICHCGEACTVACQTFSTTDPLPTVNDCNVLATVLRGLSTTIGRTFVQGTGFPNPIIVDFSTCRAALGNIRTDGQAVEYCWDGLADNVNSGVSGCIAPHISSGATCTGQSNTWEMAVSGLNRNG